MGNIIKGRNVNPALVVIPSAARNLVLVVIPNGARNLVLVVIPNGARNLVLVVIPSGARNLAEGDPFDFAQGRLFATLRMTIRTG
jgi:hypothetical protein